MKRNWLYMIVITAVTLSVWGGLPAQQVKAGSVDFAVWDFETSNTTPKTDLQGGSTAAGGGGLTSPTWPTGNAPTADVAWCYTGWTTGTLDTSDYFEFHVNLTNYGHITLSFDERRSSTGIRDFEVQYSTDGTNFTQIPATMTNVPNDTNWRSHTFDLGAGTTTDMAIRGQSSVYFRIYGYSAGGAAATWRIDNVTFNASTNPTAVTLHALTATTAPATDLAILIFVAVSSLFAALLLRQRITRTSSK